MYICGVEWKFDIQELEQFSERFKRILDKKTKLDCKRPLPSYVLQKIKDDLFVEWTYNSNSIEGNSLTLQETKIVLEDGITIGGKSLREHYETTNHHEALAYLESIIDKNYLLDEKDILSLHKIVMTKIEKEFAGRYRSGRVRIMGANFTPPNALKVYNLMKDLISWTNENPLKLNDITLATVFHHRFVHIHPFFDGNGRTVRLAMNLLLIRNGFPPAIILKNDRKKYYAALNQANNGKYEKLILLMIQALERSLDIYLSAYPTENLDDEYLNISSIVEEPDIPYGQEYVSLLARQGKIDAFKEGRNWLTSKTAVKEYIQNKKLKKKLN